MTPPTVSFVVPCYKLAHLLPDCVNSILGQTYGDLEVLIMDDCSPDETAQVAHSFKDPRVQHVRSEPNLGHLRNYNKGIGLARGKYVWLISADDYLRKAHVLERYLDVLEGNPNVGYAFCAGVGVVNGQETGPLAYTLYAQSDRVEQGHKFMGELLRANIVLSASGIVRRECYDKLGVFPLDMPFAGDWYLWLLFAMHFDVAYFAEPMVAYRQHDLSMTSGFSQKGAETCCREEIAVLWAVKGKADGTGRVRLSNQCLDALGDMYARQTTTCRYGMSNPLLDLDQLEDSLCRGTTREWERKRIRARAYAGIGNHHYWRGDRALAREFYRKALINNPWLATVGLKRVALSLGGPGDRLRKAILSWRSAGRNGKLTPRDANGV